MKKIFTISILLAAAAAFSAFTLQNTIPSAVTMQDIQFKVMNDTNAPYDYYANNTHLTLEAGSSNGFSYTAGTVIYKWTNNAQGAAWFTVTAGMQGQSYTVSGLSNK